MIALFIRLTCALTILFAAFMALIAAQPVDHHAVNDFFRCATQPCWRGIVPGVTLEDEALPILTSDPTVSELTNANRYAFDKWYAWMWSDAYPATAPVIGGWEGGIYFDTKSGRGDVVNRLFLATALRVGDLWTLYSAPDEFLTLFTYTGAHYFVSMDMRYGALIAMSGFTGCPLTLGQVLHQPLSLWVNANIVRLQVLGTSTARLDLRHAIIAANRSYCLAG